MNCDMTRTCTPVVRTHSTFLLCYYILHCRLVGWSKWVEIVKRWWRHVVSVPLPPPPPLFSWSNFFSSHLLRNKVPKWLKFQYEQAEMASITKLTTMVKSIKSRIRMNWWDDFWPTPSPQEDLSQPHTYHATRWISQTCHTENLSHGTDTLWPPPTKGRRMERSKA